MARHPKSVFADDARHVARSLEHRNTLNLTIRRLLSRDAAADREIYNSIALVLDDFELLGERFLSNPRQELKDRFLVDIKKGRVSKNIPAFLGWMCYYQPDLAMKFYAAVGLPATTVPPRTYPARPGYWAAERRQKDAGAASPQADARRTFDPGPILPRGKATPDPDRNYPAAPIKFPHPGGIRYAEFSPCGRFIVTAGRQLAEPGPGVFVWTIDQVTEDDRKSTVSVGADSDVLTATFSPDSNFIVWATENVARLSYAHTRSRPLFEMAHSHLIAHCAFSADGSKIVTASWDQTACIWDARSGRRLHTISPRPRSDHVVNSAFFSNDGKRLLTACSDCKVQIWDIARNSVLSSFESDKRDWTCGAMFSRDENSIITAGPESGTAYIWDAKTGAVKIILGGPERHKDTTLCAVYSPDERSVLTAGDDRQALIWSVSSQSVIRRIPHAAKIWVAWYSPDGRHVLTACDDGHAYLWPI